VSTESLSDSGNVRYISPATSSIFTFASLQTERRTSRELACLCRPTPSTPRLYQYICQSKVESAVWCRLKKCRKVYLRKHRRIICWKTWFSNFLPAQNTPLSATVVQSMRLQYCMNLSRLIMTHILAMRPPKYKHHEISLVETKQGIYQRRSEDFWPWKAHREAAWRNIKC